MIGKSKRYAIDKVFDLSTVLQIKRIISQGILPCHRAYDLQAVYVISFLYEPA
jgi:hypothetical protein